MRCFSFLSRFASLLMAALLVLTATSIDGFCRTWYIKADGSGDAPNIQAGVDSAAAGDVVLVGPGVYTHTTQIVVDNQPKVVNVNMQKSIRLVSEGGASATAIDGSSSDITIFVSGVDNSAEIRGFDVHGVPYGVGCILPSLQRTSHAQPPPWPINIMGISSSCLVVDNVIHDNPQ